jgi:hypothetical protein
VKRLLGFASCVTCVATAVMVLVGAPYGWYLIFKHVRFCIEF